MSAEFPRVPRVWQFQTFSPGRFGIVHPNMPWQDVLKAYYWDNLKVAMSLAEDAGVGAGAGYLTLYRMIEAEHVTREVSEFSDRGDWLLLEHVPEHSGLALEQVESVVRHACDQVAEAFAWQHGPATLVTFLHPVVDAPYTPGRDGFFIDKFPFDKICLPSHLFGDEARLVSALRHEYAHAMSLNRTEGRCPLWLHEAIAMSAQYLRPVTFRKPQQWKDPVMLERAFRHERETHEGASLVGDAYAQAGILGSHLVSLKGTAGLGELLDAFVDNSFVKNLVMEATGQPPEDEALKQVYGFGLKDLFARAA